MVDTTIQVLRKLDQLRAAAYSPAFSLPTTPAEPPDDPCATEFVKAPAREAYRKANEVYQAALRKLDRDIRTYTSSFEKDWGQIDVGGTAKPSRLAGAAATAGLSLSAASCLVAEVSGKCGQVCIGHFASGAAKPVDSRYCEAGVEAASWSSNCRADFLCLAHPELSNAKTGIAYHSQVFRVRLLREFKSKKDPLMADFQSRISKVGYGDVIKFSPVVRWRFDNGWIIEAAPNASPEVAVQNAQCCIERTATVKAKEAQEALTAGATAAKDDAQE